jgi:hypothetical protein
VSLARDLCLDTVDAIVKHLDLDEIHGEDSSEYQLLTSPMVPDGSVGSFRVWNKPDVVTIAYVGITVEMIHLDSHMMFAWAPATSPVPAMTVDSVQFSESEYAFHLDVTPKLDLGAHLAYMDYCYGALTPIRAAAAQIEGLSPAEITERQHALMSEWMCVNRATADAFGEMHGIVDQYRDHWLTLVDKGIPEEMLDGVTPEQISDREHKNRSFVFNPDVDPVWEKIGQLIGEDEAEQLCNTLGTPGLGL